MSDHWRLKQHRIPRLSHSLPFECRFAVKYNKVNMQEELEWTTEKYLCLEQIKHIQLKIHQHPAKRLKLEDGLIDKGEESWDFLSQV